MLPTSFEYGKIGKSWGAGIDGGAGIRVLTCYTLKYIEASRGAHNAGTTNDGISCCACLDHRLANPAYSRNGVDHQQANPAYSRKGSLEGGELGLWPGH